MLAQFAAASIAAETDPQLLEGILQTRRKILLPLAARAKLRRSTVQARVQPGSAASGSAPATRVNPFMEQSTRERVLKARITTGQAAGSHESCKEAPPSDRVDKGSNVDVIGNWAAVSFNNEPIVHFLPGPGEVPFCRRRRGDKGRPLVRVAAAGHGAATLAALLWPASVCCAECVVRMPLGAAAAIRDAML